VHVAVVIFGAGDVREDGVLVALDDQSHSDSSAGGLERHAGVHQGERSAANGSHRGGPVGFKNVGHDADGVGEINFGRQQVGQRAFGQSTVPYFAASRTTKEFHFANGEGWEVVVQ